MSLQKIARQKIQELNSGNHKIQTRIQKKKEQVKHPKKETDQTKVLKNLKGYNQKKDAQGNTIYEKQGIYTKKISDKGKTFKENYIKHKIILDKNGNIIKEINYEPQIKKDTSTQRGRKKEYAIEPKIEKTYSQGNIIKQQTYKALPIKDKIDNKGKHSYEYASHPDQIIQGTSKTTLGS